MIALGVKARQSAARRYNVQAKYNALLRAAMRRAAAAKRFLQTVCVRNLESADHTKLFKCAVHARYIIAKKQQQNQQTFKDISIVMFTSCTHRFLADFFSSSITISKKKRFVNIGKFIFGFSH